RATELAPGVGGVVLEIERRRGTVVLTGGVDRCRIAEATLVFRVRASIEMVDRGAPAAELLPKVVRRVGADETLGQVVRLDQEEPVVVRRCERLVGLSVHGRGRRDVEDREACDALGVIADEAM